MTRHSVQAPSKAITYRREGDQVRVLAPPSLEMLIPASEFPGYRERLEAKGYQLVEEAA